MVEAGSGFGLQTEPGNVQWSSEFPFEDHLEGDDAVEADLPRSIHNPHAAAGDFLQQLVIAEIAERAPHAGR